AGTVGDQRYSFGGAVSLRQLKAIDIQAYASGRKKTLQRGGQGPRRPEYSFNFLRNWLACNVIA
ncbi:MAG: hypothetical protein KDA61_21620, partial [Planctomycetales bacterium]|nr:hypothetical protein [Planctomycetales bacterium]